MSPRRFVFHPLVVLLCSLLGALLYAAYAASRFSGDKLRGVYIYVVPIVVPFIAFLFDRAKRFRGLAMIVLVVDILVVGISMWRVVGHVPYISGHALFLSYALLSSRTRIARGAAAVVMLQVIYLKYIVWHDWITPTSGIVLGTLAAFIAWRFEKAEVAPVLPEAAI